MDAAITIRPAPPADSSATADLYLASRRAHLPYAPLAHSDESVREFIAGMVLRGEVHVAVQAGEFLGMLALARAHGFGWIDQPYLRLGFTGHGLGSRLVALAKAELGPPIRLYTFQQNHAARRFYERHGFVAIEFGDGSANEEAVADALYECSPPIHSAISRLHMDFQDCDTDRPQR